MKTKFKLTPLEKSWILYDIGNSAFILMVSTLIPIFFNSLADSAGVNEDLYLSYWGYAGSVATILVGIIGPICGTLADRNLKKPIFMTTVAVGAVILARNDIPEDAIYALTADIFATAADANAAAAHAKYSELSLEYGASITSVPYHAGAAKYFTEKGFTVPVAE